MNSLESRIHSADNKSALVKTTHNAMNVAYHIDANMFAAGLFAPQTKPRVHITQRRWIGLKCYQHGA